MEVLIDALVYAIATYVLQSIIDMPTSRDQVQSRQFAKHMYAYECVTTDIFSVEFMRLCRPKYVGSD